MNISIICQKNQHAPVSGVIKETGAFLWNNWRKDAGSEAIIVDLEERVQQDRLLRKIEKVMDD